jgi:mono/diheme cytochrome c family protein
LGAQGQGYPPLAGSEIVNGGSRRVGMIVLKGLQGPITVKGMQFGTAVMQAWDKTLSDAKIADVITYIRQEWGNKASAVSAAQIAALRKELAGHPGSFVEADLHAAPDEDLPGGEAGGAKPPEAAPPSAPK